MAENGLDAWGENRDGHFFFFCVVDKSEEKVQGTPIVSLF
jgi:hypothetical protein